MFAGAGRGEQRKPSWNVGLAEKLGPDIIGLDFLGLVARGRR